ARGPVPRIAGVPRPAPGRAVPDPRDESGPVAGARRGRIAAERSASRPRRAPGASAPVRRAIHRAVFAAAPGARLAEPEVFRAASWQLRVHVAAAPIPLAAIAGSSCLPPALPAVRRAALASGVRAPRERVPARRGAGRGLDIPRSWSRFDALTRRELAG